MRRLAEAGGGFLSHRRKLTLEELAAQPFIRPGADIFDCAYANEILDARNRLALNKMIEAEPDKPHESPDGLLHYVPHKRPT